MNVRNILGNRYHGQIGKDTIASSWKGDAYIKAYAVPHNPRTERQQANRTEVGAAKVPWRELTDEERTAWNRAAKGESGWNLFVGEFMRTDGHPGRLPPGAEAGPNHASPTTPSP